MNRAPLLFMLLLLTGCERPASNGGAIDAENPLEMVARERGIVHDPSADPSGVFERRHELGRDVMCIVPDDGAWRFAMSASFGANLSCNVDGRIERYGDGWRLTFADGDDCTLVVREEGDELRLPGSIPERCDRLCPNRASLGGLRLPRASWSVDDARRLQMPDDQGNMTMPCRD